jgi:CheY-like chemotaxis protein
MPDMDGITLAREVRARLGEDTPFLVALSSVGGLAREDREAFHASLTKPVKPSYLFDVLAGLFSSRKEVHRPKPGNELDRELGKRLPMRILVAEDNTINQKLLLTLLSRMGYRADVASNGSEALAAVKRQAYDIILMDVQMPEMDGLEATRQVRIQLPREQQPRIVALTANAMLEDREACMSAGMDDYLAKPIQFEELHGVLIRYGQEARKNADGGSGVAVSDDGSSRATPPPQGEDTQVDFRTLKEMEDLIGKESVDQLCGIYLQEGPRLLTLMEQALEEKDWTGLRLASHTLRGSSLNLGFNSVAKAAEQIETRCRDGGAPEVEGLLSEASAAVQWVCDKLRERQQTP